MRGFTHPARGRESTSQADAWTRTRESAPDSTACATPIMHQVMLRPLRQSTGGCVCVLELSSLLGGAPDRSFLFPAWRIGRWRRTLSGSLECLRHTHWPRLVKQHAAICLPPVKNAPSLACFFLPCRPSMSSFIMAPWARPRLLTQTRCNLFNPPLSWADKAWPPGTLLHLTQPEGGGIVSHFITSVGPPTLYRPGGFDLECAPRVRARGNPRPHARWG